LEEYLALIIYKDTKS